MDNPFIESRWSIIKCYYGLADYSIFIMKNHKTDKMYIANQYKSYKNIEEWLLTEINFDKINALEKHELKGTDFLLQSESFFILRCIYDEVDAEEIIKCQYEDLILPPDIYEL